LLAVSTDDHQLERTLLRFPPRDMLSAPSVTFLLSRLFMLLFCGEQVLLLYAWTARMANPAHKFMCKYKKADFSNDASAANCGR
jgi:hypothetical protein